jgi:hypothetical protein
MESGTSGCFQPGDLTASAEMSWPDYHTALSALPNFSATSANYKFVIKQLKQEYHH